MGLFVCNRLILQARPHKLNKRGNWVLIKSKEWGCVKDTTTPDKHKGVKCVWLIPPANSILAQGTPGQNLLMSGWKGNPFPFMSWLHSEQREKGTDYWELLPARTSLLGWGSSSKGTNCLLPCVCAHLAEKRTLPVSHAIHWKKYLFKGVVHPVGNSLVSSKIDSVQPFIYVITVMGFGIE